MKYFVVVFGLTVGLLAETLEIFVLGDQYYETDELIKVFEIVGFPPIWIL